MLVILPWKLLTIAVYKPIWSHFSLQHPPLWRLPCKWNVATQPLKRTLAEWVGGCQLSLMSGCCFKKMQGAMQVTVEGSWLTIYTAWRKNGVPYFTHHPLKKFPVYPAVKSSVAWHFPNDGIRPSRRCIVHWCTNLISIPQVHPATSSRKDLVASHACELSWVAVPACYEEAPKCCYRWKTHLSSCTRTSMSCFAPVGSRKSQIQSCKVHQSSNCWKFWGFLHAAFWAFIGFKMFEGGCFHNASC